MAVAVSDEALCRSCGEQGTDRFLGLQALWRCGSCGLAWRAAREDGPASDLYGVDFFSSGSYYSSYFARAPQWRHEARLRLRWLLGFETAGRLFEAGSGGGYFIEAAAAAGIEAVGLEPADDGARYAREVLAVDVRTGTFEETALPGAFDAVCAFHVLEHVEDPWTFLVKARDLLRPGGFLFLEVPNIDSRRALRDRARWYNLAPDHHLWHFSPTTLARLVERSGFVVVARDTVFPRHYFRARRLLTRSGLANAVSDWRCNPRPARSHPTDADHLRLVARRPPAVLAG